MATRVAQIRVAQIPVAQATIIPPTAVARTPAAILQDKIIVRAQTRAVPISGISDRSVRNPEIYVWVLN
jgi:hypothetical protein